MSSVKVQTESKLSKEGIHMDESHVDVAEASWDQSLSKVWTDEASGELCASIDRLLFESPLSVAVRFIEPQGFNLNLENLLACIDSMKFGVFAKASPPKSSEAKYIAKKIAPALYARLPERSARGPLLSRFYEEISKYEGELSRLQQYEAQSRRAAQAAVKDESGKNAIIQLQQDNENLRNEIERLSRKVQQLNSAIESVPLNTKETLLPVGARNCTVRHVNPQENLIHLKSDQGQYTFPLNRLQGIPAVNTRAISLHEGGLVRQVWLIDSASKEFTFDSGVILNIEGNRVKVRRTDRSEILAKVQHAQGKLKINDPVLLKLADEVVVEIVPFNKSMNWDFLEKVQEEQVMERLSGVEGE